MGGWKSRSPPTTWTTSNRVTNNSFGPRDSSGADVGDVGFPDVVLLFVSVRAGRVAAASAGRRLRVADTTLVGAPTAVVAAAAVARVAPLVVAAVDAPEVVAPREARLVEVRPLVPVARVAQALGAGAIRGVAPARALGAGAVVVANVARRTRPADAVADVLLVLAERAPAVRQVAVGPTPAALAAATCRPVTAAPLVDVADAIPSQAGRGAPVVPQAAAHATAAVALPVPRDGVAGVHDACVARVAAPKAAVAGPRPARASANGPSAAVAPSAHLADRVPALPGHPMGRLGPARSLLAAGRAAPMGLRDAGADEATEEVVVAAVEVAAVERRPPPTVVLLVAAPSPEVGVAGHAKGPVGAPAVPTDAVAPSGPVLLPRPRPTVVEPGVPTGRRPRPVHVQAVADAKDVARVATGRSARQAGTAAGRTGRPVRVPPITDLQIA